MKKEEERRKKEEGRKEEEEEEEEEEETWSATLKEEHRLTGTENRVPRKIFRPKRDEVTGEWRTLYDVVLPDQNSSPDFIRVIKSRRVRLAGHVA